MTVSNQECHLYEIDLGRACKICPRLYRTIPYSFHDGKGIRHQYMQACSPEQAVTQILSQLGNTKYRPHWAYDELLPRLVEIVREVRHSRPNRPIENRQLPLWE